MLKTDLTHEITEMNPKNSLGAISPSAEGKVGTADSAALLARIVRKRKITQSRQHNQRLRLLIESVEDYGIFMLDRAGRISSWNPGAKRMKGYSSEEILGQHFSIFYTIEQRRAHQPEIQRVLPQPLKRSFHHAAQSPRHGIEIRRETGGHARGIVAQREMLVAQDFETAAIEQRIDIGNPEVGEMARNVDAAPSFAHQKEFPARRIGNLQDQAAVGTQQGAGCVQVGAWVV